MMRAYDARVYVARDWEIVFLFFSFFCFIAGTWSLKCQFDENWHQIFPHFFAQNSQFNRETFFDVNKIEYNHSSGRKSCYKPTNFSSAINRNRFQLSPQFNSSRSPYDVILVTFHNVSQSKHPKAMDFALLQVRSESISGIFFRVNAQTETLDAFEYLQRRFLVPMCHDYIITDTRLPNRSL